MQENENEIPESILNKIRKRSNRSEQTRFPYKIFSLLEWAGKDEQKSQKAGCGWITDTEFFINKSKLCEVLGVKINTLNVNLKDLGFEQCDAKQKNLTFWENPLFSETMTAEDAFLVRAPSKIVPQKMSVSFEFRPLYNQNND